MKQCIVRLVASCAMVAGGFFANATAEPFVLSENVQLYAQEVELSEKLGIEWKGADAEDIARYIHTLTTIEVAAVERAHKRGQDEPVFADYDVAASLFLCNIDFPFKPPRNGEYSGPVEHAYYRSERREAIRGSLGSTFLTADIETLRQEKQDPASIEEFLENYLNFYDLYERSN